MDDQAEATDGSLRCGRQIAPWTSSRLAATFPARSGCFLMGQSSVVRGGGSNSGTLSQALIAADRSRAWGIALLAVRMYDK
ncbi:hypothetical protein [Lysobacter terrae]